VQVARVEIYRYIQRANQGGKKERREGGREGGIVWVCWVK